MSKEQDRIVYYDSQISKWVNKRITAQKAASHHDTQADAYDKAKDQIGKSGGGEITIKSKHGPIRDKHTIPPANDPRDIPG